MSQATRNTKQRTVMLNVLKKLKTHPTADEVYHIVREQIPKISLGTVYRNLEILAENGEILKIENAGSQKRFDGDLSPHQHVRCTHCGRIGDIMTTLPMTLDKIPSVEGFKITNTRIEFEGICDKCATLSN
ncbi:Fur family transcriptional regulator [Desulfovibrio litoralis]|uniref:Fur family transcriptional regulator, ferric uptake regulator n=1 Tax=Desulfovibrio litoralis DSM 11393 TaxID=1121455 RepID=A0A1M7SC72_9BACT|nr:transcriptional repressor [Desulfovibrio litoralis]SHN56075.1 Fur family transcriptional regulator, ferric uptake regulator [Desulfovibrio litoralis DSM 11393]